jgi:hypothetical protein
MELRSERALVSNLRIRKVICVTKLHLTLQPVYDFAFRAAAGISRLSAASGFSLRPQFEFSLLEEVS